MNEFEKFCQADFGFGFGLSLLPRSVVEAKPRDRARGVKGIRNQESGISRSETVI